MVDIKQQFALDTAGRKPGVELVGYVLFGFSAMGWIKATLLQKGIGDSADPGVLQRNNTGTRYLHHFHFGQNAILHDEGNQHRLMQLQIEHDAIGRASACCLQQRVIHQTMHGYAGLFQHTEQYAELGACVMGGSRHQCRSVGSEALQQQLQLTVGKVGMVAEQFGLVLQWIETELVPELIEILARMQARHAPRGIAEYGVLAGNIGPARTLDDYALLIAQAKPTVFQFNQAHAVSRSGTCMWRIRWLSQ